MYVRGSGLRWIVLAAFAIFAVFSLGSLFLGRYRPPDQSPTPSPSTKVLQQASPTTKPPTVSVTPTPRTNPPTTPAPQNPTPTSAADPLYLVNKQASLPASYVPPDLVTLTTVRATSQNQKVRRFILPYLEKLMDDAKSAGHELSVSSAYRSYSEQEEVHAYWERALGKAEADRVSATAGHSEHQLGTTVDLTSASVGFELVEKFGTMPEGKWLKENAYRYGFVISYPEGKEAVTGYAYEPWHIRYVGVDVAATVNQKGITLDEYLRSKR